jgi:glucose-6-phosphate 1-dehydrogenase
MGHREAVEMIASRHPRPEETEAYERVLGDAMAGDSTLFARQDYVEEAWRIVDPILRAEIPLFTYEPNSWGPQEDSRLRPAGGWDKPEDE